MNAPEAPTPMSEGVDLEALRTLVEHGQTLAAYCRWTIGPESCGHHPTMPSAVAQFEAALKPFAAHGYNARARIRELEAARPAPAIPAVGGGETPGHAIARFIWGDAQADEKYAENGASHYDLWADAALSAAPPPASRGENELREALARFEWSSLVECEDGSFLTYCPACNEQRERGHADDCWLHAALAPPAHDHAQGER